MAGANKDKQSNVNENINVSRKFFFFLLTQSYLYYILVYSQWNIIEGLDDIFDIVDDDNDTLEYEEDELNKYYLSGHLNSIEHEDEMIDDDSYDNDSNVIEVRPLFFF